MEVCRVMALLGGLVAGTNVLTEDSNAEQSA
jgi:hypothetical protein